MGAFVLFFFLLLLFPPLFFQPGSPHSLFHFNRMGGDLPAQLYSMPEFSKPVCKNRYLRGPRLVPVKLPAFFDQGFDLRFFFLPEDWDAV